MSACSFFTSIGRSAGVVFLLIWPLFRWVLSINVFFQFLRMLYYWDNQEVNAGCVFLLHFSVLFALTFLVSSINLEEK